MKQARRITPELMSPSQQTTQPAFAEAAQLQRPVQRLTLKEQAAFAKENLPAGRHLYVDLSQKCDFDYKKVKWIYKPCQKALSDSWLR